MVAGATIFRTRGICKSFTPKAANFIAAESVQLHDAVGFTRECNAQVNFRRAKRTNLLLGATGWQRHQLADPVLGKA